MDCFGWRNRGFNFPCCFVFPNNVVISLKRRSSEVTVRKEGERRNVKVSLTNVVFLIVVSCDKRSREIKSSLFNGFYSTSFSIQPFIILFVLSLLLSLLGVETFSAPEKSSFKIYSIQNFVYFLTYVYLHEKPVRLNIHK